MRAGRYLLLTLSVAGCDPELPARQRPTAQRSSVAAAASPTVAPPSAELLRDTMLDLHSRERTAAGVPPLSWDKALATEALHYARSMAVSGQFRHSDQPNGPARQGENLWTGARGEFSLDEMFEAWAAERRVFVNRASPAYSRTGRWQDAAHYAQIVWRSTTRLGCALASNRDSDFLVCRYAPSGNMLGQKPY